MKLRWERPREGLARGFGDNGHELAQVAHVYSANHDDLGWTTYLTHEPGDPGELFESFPTAEAAMAAAEAAIGLGQDETEEP